MSGGTFDYQEFHIGEIAEDIRNKILNYRDPEWCKRALEEHSWHKENDGGWYSEETLQVMEEAYKVLYIAHIFAKRIDYLEAGDDGEESFLLRTIDEIKNAQEWFAKCFRKK